MAGYLSCRVSVASSREGKFTFRKRICRDIWKCCWRCYVTTLWSWTALASLAYAYFIFVLWSVYSVRGGSSQVTHTLCLQTTIPHHC